MFFLCGSIGALAGCYEDRLRVHATDGTGGTCCPGWSDETFTWSVASVSAAKVAQHASDRAQQWPR